MPTVCPECGKTLEPAAPHACSGQSAALLDAERFVAAGTAEDPLTAEAYVAVLTAERIPVLTREARSGSVDMLTSPAMDWWEIRVPEHLLDRARSVLAAETERLQRSQAEAVQAAEEESQEGIPAE